MSTRLNSSHPEICTLSLHRRSSDLGTGHAFPAGIVAAGVRAAIVAGVAPLVDVAELVDEEVVADVAPALGHRVVVVDRPDLALGTSLVDVVVGGVRVVHDELLG